MSPASIKPRGRGAFGAVSVTLQIGHSLVTVATIALGLAILVQLSPARLPLVRWTGLAGTCALAILALHSLLMLATPLWHWLAARGQTRVSRLWAWLGYFIPLASYGLPARNLSRLIEGSAEDIAALKTLVLAWGVVRSLAAPLVVAGVVYGLYRLGPTSNVTAGMAVAYMVVIVATANVLSLLTVSRVHRRLATTEIDERHAAAFS